MSSSGHIADMIARYNAGRAEIRLRRARRSKSYDSNLEGELDIPRGTKEGSRQFQSKMRRQKQREQRQALVALYLVFAGLMVVFALVYHLTMG